MGTSKSFSSTKHPMQPNWPDLSRSMTSNANGGTISEANKKQILHNYVTAIGGASTAGRGGSKVGGKSSIRAAKRLGSFFGGFINSGNNIREALSATGLTNIEGKTVSDVVNHLIEYCSGSAASIDDHAAKKATEAILKDLVTKAENIDDIQNSLTEFFNINTSEDLIIKYFGYYIYEHLQDWFYEKLLKGKEEENTNNLYRELKNFIFSELNNMQKRNPLQNIDWSGEDADRLIKNIQQDVLTVFE